MAGKSPKNRTAQRKQKPPVKKEPKGSGFWIGLICFSSLWMFILGILVGRGTAPVQFDIEKFEKELVALKELVLKKEKERMRDYADGAGDTGLEFYEDLKKPKDPEIKKPRVSGPIPSLQESADHGEKKTSLARKTKKEYGLTAGEKELPPVKIPEPSPVQQAPPDMKTALAAPGQVQSSEYKYTIQVSSLKDPAAAEKIVQKLKQKGYEAYSMGANVAEKGKWFRVRVGPFKDKKEAETQLNRLKSDNYNAILISL